MASNPIVVTGGVAFSQQPQINQQIPPNGWSLGGLFFDAWLSMMHNSSLTVTSHPVETGANITDHSFVNPRRFSFELGVTNSVSNASVGSFPAAPTRAINAYAALSNLQENRTPLTLICKYGTFDNILIDNLSVPDDASTVEASRFMVSLVEIIRSDVRKVTVVSRFPQITGSSNRGKVNQRPLSSIFFDNRRFLFGGGG